ncbi:LIM domain-binding protein 1 isoform X5 [Alligator sinensis]|uniref:LIM domain-binding protein 1 isoform X5 n=1 Tax=Alligator sinensis TaxID=38654 RepID=A0A3Q0HLU0_ALLSI|nr:LIM domain-binding protein 1 isoform X5 [Alligator sinensis]
MPLLQLPPPPAHHRGPLAGSRAQGTSSSPVALRRQRCPDTAAPERPGWDRRWALWGLGWRRVGGAGPRSWLGEAESGVGTCQESVLGGLRGAGPSVLPGFGATSCADLPLVSPPGCSSKSFKLYSPKEPPNGNAFPPFHPGTMLDRDVGPTPMYPPTYLEPGIGRHTPYGNQTDYRIFELNKRLQNWTEECDNLWWDAFTTEFFEDDAMLTITFCLEDGPKRYTIGRTLIPRYFRSIFEGGATELYYVLKHPKESFHNNFVSLDCDQCTMVTQHGKPMFTQVCVEGRLYLEFMFDDMMRIKTWHFSIRQHRELIPRSILAMHAQDPQMLDQLSKNITRCGLSNSTLNYLRVSVGWGGQAGRAARNPGSPSTSSDPSQDWHGLNLWLPNLPPHAGKELPQPPPGDGAGWQRAEAQAQWRSPLERALSRGRGPEASGLLWGLQLWVLAGAARGLQSLAAVLELRVCLAP